MLIAAAIVAPTGHVLATDARRIRSGSNEVQEDAARRDRLDSKALFIISEHVAWRQDDNDVFVGLAVRVYVRNPVRGL